MSAWIDYREMRPLRFPRDHNTPFPERATIRLSKVERQAISEMTRLILSNPYVVEEQESFIESARRIAIDALDELTHSRIRNELELGLGAVLVTNLPCEVNLPDTPPRVGSLDPGYKKTFLNEALLFVFGLLTGAEPFNFRQEARGTAPLIDNVVPVRELRSVKGTGGYENNFPFHCEIAWHRKRPDYLALLGVRECPSARTLVFSTERLESAQWNLECSGEFRLRAPDLYIEMEAMGMPLGTPRYRTTQVVRRVGKRFEINVNFNGTDCADQTAVSWLSRLESFIEQNAVATVLGPGKVLILNNNRTCHSRTGYSPNFRGQDRWFVRGYFKRNLWKADSGCPENTELICGEQELRSLVRLGWMTPEQRLTEEFLKYVREPAEVRALSKSKARLAALAFHFTPIEGTRIV